MNKTLTQCNAILKHLQSGGKITSLEAVARFGCMRLASRIFDLKQRGIAIDSEMISSGDSKFKQYWIEK